MMEWKQVKLGDVCRKVCSGGTPKSTNRSYYDGGTIPWLNTKEINFSYLDRTEGYITQEGLDNSSAKWIPANCVIVAMYGATAGKVAINNIPITTNQACCNLEIDSSLANFQFIYYYLCGKYTELASLANGGAQQNLNAQIIKDFDLSLPPLPTQRRIAAILSSLDAQIENNNRINRNLEAQAQALFKSWFVDFEPWGGVMPEGWKEVSLTNIANYLNGLAMQKFPAIKGEESLPVLKIKELGAKCIDESSDRCTSNIKSDYIVENGDVIFSWSGTLLVDIWTGGKAGLNQHLFKVTSNKYQKWFYLMWTKHHLEDFIHIAKDKAVTMGHIKRGHLEAAICNVPDKDVMKKANALFEPLVEQMINVRIQSARLASLRDTLLPKLMKGEIEV